jgi:hypothetical protein
MKGRLAITLATLLLAGCGGGGGSAAAPSPAKQQSTVNGSVVITIPASSAITQSLSRNSRYPQFVSPNASSVAMSINGGADTLFDVSPTSSLCTTVAGVGRNCTLTFGAPSGMDTFTFLIFAGANGSGTQLASATKTQAIVQGQAFSFAVALNAAVGVMMLSITPAGSGGTCPNSIVSFTGLFEGCPGSGTLNLTVEDPTGAPITGTAPYATAIALTTNDPSLTATPAQITAPGSAISVSYSGAPFAASFTNSAVVTATAGGQSAQVNTAVRRSYLYVANSNAPVGTMPPGGGNVAVYAFGASGGTAPVRTFTGANTSITSPIQPLVDANGNLYVLDNGIPVSNNFNANIFVFAPTANTGTINVAPIRTIGNMSSLTNQACSDMVFDPTQQFLFVACGTEIQVFPITANGLASSVVATQMEDDSLEAGALAFNQSGDLYIADDSFNGIGVVSAPLPTSGAFHMIGNSRTLAPPGSWPLTLTAVKIAVDNSGTLFAPLFFLSPSAGAPDAVAELGIWNSTQQCTNCGPSASLTGAPFSTHAVTGIALDPAGNVYVVNSFTNGVTEFARSTIVGATVGTDNPAVLRTLANSTGATGPFGMTIGP